MVRSKGEDQARELFHLVDKIRVDRKYFPVSLDEIERELSATGFFDCYGDYECDDDGQMAATRLRMNLRAPGGYVQSWAVSLKLHDIRIDGIDHHEWLALPNGKRGPGGWHRHEWLPSQRKAERRVRMEKFDKGLKSLRLFLVKAFQELRIEVNKQDDGNQLLRFD